MHKEIYLCIYAANLVMHYYLLNNRENMSKILQFILKALPYLLIGRCGGRKDEKNVGSTLHS